MAVEALSFHIAGMQEDAETIPRPSSLDELRRDPALRDAVAFLVDVKEPEKTVRINITARESEIAEIDNRARAARLTRSAYMVRRSLQTGGFTAEKKISPGHASRLTAKTRR